MTKQYTLLLCAMLALLLPSFRAHATLADYGFQVTSGQYIDISGNATQVLQPADDDVTSAILNIGFTFYFDGQPYDQFTVSSNGLVGLGPSRVSPCWENQLTTGSGLCAFNGGYDYTGAVTPQLAADWDDMRIPALSDGDDINGIIRYATVGEEPNRVLVIDFWQIETSYRTYDPSTRSTWQVRLYEGSNRIEYYYDYLSPNYFHDGATIGMSVNPENFLSVTPNEDGTADITTVKPNDYYYLNEAPIPPGTMYVFSPCQMVFNGDVKAGGTEFMNNGDELLVGQQSNIGQAVDFYPFSIGLDGGCADGKYTIALGGQHPDDYKVDPNPGPLNPGEPIWPTITFTPSGAGVRRAEMTITDSKGRSITFILAAEGVSRIQWTGDLSQGGTPDVANGDVLMSNIHVRRLEVGNFTPLTVTNISENEQLPPAVVTFAIKGMSGGQYSVDPAETSLDAGESATPTITFAPTGVGPIRDSLFVNADGEIRAFELLAISDAAGAEFYVNGQLVDSTSNVFVNQYGCVGVGPITMPLQVKNIGNQDFTINRVEFYRTDSTYAQGVPRYQLQRDAMGNLIPSYDYIITEQPPVAPYSASQQSLPIVVPTGTTRTLYFTMISQLPGKRFARAFIYTNGETGTGSDPNGEAVEGLLSFDLFGRGLGSQLSDNPNGGLPKSVVFAPAGVGSTSDATLTLFNTGTCDLRVAMKSFKFVSGDINEFAVTSVPTATTNQIDETTGDLVLVPGASASVGVRFMPNQVGSRRATMRLETNDSTIQLPGLTERGSYYIDFYGGGANGLYGNSISFGPALIGGAAADQVHGVVTARNVTSAPIVINSITIEGTDAAEFSQDAAAAWPATPFVIPPTGSVNLGVLFAPAAGGSAGPRAATLKLVTSSGDMLVNSLDGVAGTRTVAATPGTLNFSVSSGKVTRKNVMIVNTGSMPLTLTAPILGGPGAADFSLGSLPRLTLAPGQSEFLEVTFMPTSTTPSTATLTIGSNAPAGAIQITLNGTPNKSHLAQDPSQSATTGASHGGAINRSDEVSSTLGVDGQSSSNGVALSQSVPNPGRDVVEISYRLVARGDVQLALYDASGRLVRTLVDGSRDAGDQSVRVDLSGLASGVYHYRLVANGQTLSRTLTVVK
jgi:hypothetical protein